ncbi:hypothetical protein K474DRAFT_1682971 [Panus rudis PR-1116 ss-1]|nr:hypothetical protein K474DRAFT_1682971 [Panus rudis PR-1116 ss-1]
MVSSNDVQKLFLQAVLSRRVITKNLGIKIWEQCVNAVKATDESLEIPFSSSTDSWHVWLTKVNNALNPLNLELARSNIQETGSEVYALVNRQGDEVAQLATDYAPNEIAYFKAVVEQIMLAPNDAYCVSSLAALREVNSLRPVMTKSQGEIVLNSFVAKGWLLKSKKGRYSLSQRTLLELSQYLKNEYPEAILECTVCMDMVTLGVHCNTPNCKGNLHQYCYNAYKRTKQTCPTCGNEWNPRPVGEGAYKEGQDKGKRRAQRKDSEEGSEEEAGEDEEASQSQSRATSTQPSQSQSRSKGKKKAIKDEGMDEEEEGEAEATPPARSSQRRKGARR